MNPESLANSDDEIPPQQQQQQHPQQPPEQLEEGEEGGFTGEDGEDNTSDYLLDPSLLSEATLPISNISRLMKKALPKQAKISSSSKELIQSCCIEFISFLTSEANDKCLLEKRKTINGDDILYAMKILGFEEFEIVCKIWLSRYRMAQETANRKAVTSARGRSSSKRAFSNDNVTQLEE
ncbi:hypothetical protein CBS101457_005827 [Exobasidium rhododendri]|nr:hypothetical protein CBS101457_005827 [Exobasidium rhododendri]